MDPPDTWTGLWAPPLPFCLEPGIIWWTGLLRCCLCSSNLIYFVLQEHIMLLWTYLCRGREYERVAGSRVQKGEGGCDTSVMICWCFQARDWWQHDVGILKIKGLEPELIVLKIRSNCAEISGFSEVQKIMYLKSESHFWNPRFSKTLHVLQSDGLWHLAGRHLGCAKWVSFAPDAFWFDPFTSPAWCPVRRAAVKVSLVPEAWHWSSNTDSRLCIIDCVLVFATKHFSHRTMDY